MPTITRIYGGGKDVQPLRVTHRAGGKKKAPSIRVKCGCCNEAVVFCPMLEHVGIPEMDALEINGVYGSVAQWREILLPMLGLANPPESK